MIFSLPSAFLSGLDVGGFFEVIINWLGANFEPFFEGITTVIEWVLGGIEGALMWPHWAVIIALIVVLANRITDPVKRFLSTLEDYLTWTLTLLPLLTGYLAYHHLFLNYTLMLALHILTVELLLVALPFTKLFHTFSLFAARWYNGDISGRKGVAS